MGLFRGWKCRRLGSGPVGNLRGAKGSRLGGASQSTGSLLCPTHASLKSIEQLLRRN